MVYFRLLLGVNFFRDGIENSEANYSQISNSLKFFANAVATCPKTRKFRRRLKILERELQKEEPDPDIARWIELILSNRKEKKASQGKLEALGYEKKASQGKLEAF